MSTTNSKPLLVHPGLQDFATCLGLLAPVLDDLGLVMCEPPMITSESLRTLWTCPNLRNLSLEDCGFDILAEDLGAGLQHLRSAATTPDLNT